MLVSSVLLAACGGAAPEPAAPAQEEAQEVQEEAPETVELKIAHFMAPAHPMHAAVMAPMAEKLGEVSNGNLTAKVYPAGELGSGPVEQYNRAIDGVTDIAFGIPEYTPAQFPKTNLITLPGIGGVYQRYGQK